MKAAVLSCITLAIGIGAGVYCTKLEFQPADIPSLVRPGASGSPDEPARVASKPQPKIVVVSGERHNFGTMERNEKLRHEFTVRNEGGVPLTLEQGKTSCKCTVSKLVHDRIPPGQEATIELEWTATDNESTFEQNAQFMTNDPSRPIVYLSVHGDVTDVVRAEPGEVLLGEVPASEGGEGSFRIFGYRDQPLTIDKVAWSSPGQEEFFEVSSEPLAADFLAQQRPPAAQGILVKIVVKPGLPVGPLNQSCKLTTSLQPQTPLDIALRGDIVGDIRLTGPGTAADRQLVALPPVDRAEGLTKVVYLVVKGPHRETTRLNLVSTEPRDDFKATLGEAIRDNPRVDRYPLTIEIPPGARPVSHVSAGAYATIRLETTHPLTKEVLINVRYFVKE